MGKRYLNSEEETFKLQLNVYSLELSNVFRIELHLTILLSFILNGHLSKRQPEQHLQPKRLEERNSPQAEDSWHKPIPKKLHRPRQDQ